MELYVKWTKPMSTLSQNEPFARGFSPRKQTAEEIGDDQPLFGPGSLGLDSVDALQLVVALDKKYQFKIPNPEVAKEVLQNVSTMAQAVSRHQLSTAASGREPRC